MVSYTVVTNGQLEPHLHTEWLLTNGIGGFASSSILGCNTRRYHGLLCAATVPPVGRVLALNRLAEMIIRDADKERPLELSINQFRDAFHPRGDRYLKEFTVGDVARWQFDVEGVEVIKEVQLVWQQNIVGIRYTIDPKQHGSFEFRLMPFVSLRDYHSLRHASGTHMQFEGSERTMKATAGQHSLHVQSDGGRFVQNPVWWHNHTYAIETERGLDDQEDLFNPGYFAVRVDGKTTVTLWAGMEPTGLRDWDQDLARRCAHMAQTCEARGDSDLLKKLKRAANDFIVRRCTPKGEVGTTILAGYPWFTDWGRDTMISLPGLLLATGRFVEAAQVLSTFAQYVSEGMIPNVFDDYSNEPHYNTVDASLWFVHACFEYARLSKDQKTFAATLRPACEQIIRGYQKGTRYRIFMDPADGLISAGDAGTQLTWMDAKCNGVVFTPRHGKAVEINALWYNALKLMGEEDLAARVAGNFVRQFWISPFRGLCDVVNEHGRDMALRPNQIFSVSLPFSPLAEDQQHAVVETVRRELLTPMGLRTLVHTDPRYRGCYRGEQYSRDGAYHNGTVWPWLMGPFLEAYLKVNRHSLQSKQQAKVWLQPLLDHLNDTCLGQLSEVAEGDAPHRAGGCCAQAWSIAGVLRVAADLNL